MGSFRISAISHLLFAIALLLGGCGQVTGPISPFYNPTILPAWGSFNDGTTDNWVFDSSNPNITNPLPLSVTAPGFQGLPYALDIAIPAYGYSAGSTVELSSYSVHYQIVSSGPGLNLTDMTLSMWVKLESGVVTPPNQIGAQIFVKDGPETINGVVHNYQYGNGTFVKLVPGQWMQVTYNVKAPNYQANPPPDVSNIYQVGLQLAGNGSSLFTSNGVVYAASLGYQPNPY